MQSHLRVKIKSLAAEATIIRREEARIVGSGRRNKVLLSNGDLHIVVDADTGHQVPVFREGGTLRWLRDHQGEATVIEALEDEYRSLHRHRTYDVRNEARAALLAYGFLRGKAYAKVEKPKSVLPGPIVAKAADLAVRFGGTAKSKAADLLAAWIKVEPAA